MTKKARRLTKSLHSPEYTAFCKLLVAARHKSGMTQAAVARSLKRPQSFVAKYEAGERRLDLIEFIGVARAIDADTIKILRALLSKKD
jgi:DNA-binding transcriptional regulator YiaG